MTRLIILVLFALAAWQASIHYPKLLHRERQNEVVIRNEGRNSIERLRLIVGRETHVREVLAAGASVTFRLDVARDTRMELVWFGPNKALESQWLGPAIHQGPSLERHTLLMYDDGRVNHRSEYLPPE